MNVISLEYCGSNLLRLRSRPWIRSVLECKKGKEGGVFGL